MTEVAKEITGCICSDLIWMKTQTYSYRQESIQIHAF